MMIKCFVPGIPRPKGSHSAFPVKGKDGRQRVVVTSSPSLKRWERLVTEYLRVMRGKAPTSTAPIEIIMSFSFSATCASRHHSWHTHRPDIDKLVRAILDAGTQAGIYRDDGQVCLIIASKRYVPSEEAGVHITIRCLS